MSVLCILFCYIWIKSLAGFVHTFGTLASTVHYGMYIVGTAVALERDASEKSIHL